MQEPKQIRSTSGLNKVVEILLKLAIADCKVKGVTPLIVETVRTQERQYWLFGQGRTAEQLMKYHIPVKYAHKGNISPGRSKPSSAPSARSGVIRPGRQSLH